MTGVIAISGKGGTGKTTFAALVIRNLLLRGLKPVLAVDADSNSNLDWVLGVELTSTVGGVREQMTEQVQKGELPAGMPKQDLLEMQIEQSLVETRDFDLLSMGRGEGPGCYCAINNMLRVFMERLVDHYSYVVMDNEAGMEHLSRRVTQGIDAMFVISDQSRRGVRTAARIRDLALQMDLNIRQMLLVLSRVTGPIGPELKSAIEETGMELAGVVPDDPEVRRLDEVGIPLIELKEDSIAVKAVDEIMERVFQGVAT